MANRVGRTVPCDAGARSGRRRKALQFYEAANDIADLAGDADDIADAYVTLLVHAGIAAADVLCCASLGEHAKGESHSDAVSLLKKVDTAHANDLGALLSMKTRAGYSSTSISATDRTRAQRACERLIGAVGDLPTASRRLE